MASKTELDITIKAKDEASREIGKVTDSLGGLSGILGTAGKAIVGFGIAGASAAAAFGIASINQYSKVGDEVEKMSKRTGLAAESVSALRVAADMGGTSIETIEKSIKKMQLGMEVAADGTSTFGNVLNQLGLDAEEFEGQGLDAHFMGIGNAIGAVKDPTLRAQLAMEAFGVSGTQLLPMFEEGAFSMEEWKQKAKELGVSFDEVSAGNAARLNDAIGAMKTAFAGLTLQVGGELAPVITDLIENQLIPLSTQFIAMLPTIGEVTDGFKGLWQSFVQAVEAFDQSTGIITQLRIGFQEVWDRVANELAPALRELWVAMQPLMPLIEALAKVALVALVLALKIAIELLLIIIKAFVDMATFAAKVATTLLTIFKPAIETTKAVIQSLIGPIQQAIDMFNGMRAAAAAAYAAAQNAVSRAVNTITGRATGGPVTGGTPYIVGERGPELFVPSSSGTIVPNGALSGSPSIKLFEGATINVTNSADEDRLVRKVASELANVLQSQRGGLATQY